MNKYEKRQSQKNLSRRNFIGTVSAAAAAFTIVPRHVLGGNGYTSPSDMVNVAGIGVGAQGGNDIRGISSPAQTAPAQTQTQKQAGKSTG